MKKLTAIIITAIICICLTGCNKTENSNKTTETDATEQTETTVETETLASVDVTEDTKILVAYFDPANEMTEYAEEIQAVCKSDSFEIKTDIDYGKNVYKTLTDEIEQGYAVQPDIKDGVLTADYDIVFLGFPAPEGKLPAEIYSFININDLRDKIIIPFVIGFDGDCKAVTSVIDGISHGSSQAVMLNLEKETNIDNWLEGLGF